MIIQKIPLKPNELPVVIENSFPKLNPSGLLLGFLENKNKLRSALNTVDSVPDVSDLEKNVMEVLEKSYQPIDDDESEDSSYTEPEPAEEKYELPEEKEKEPEIQQEDDESEYEDDDVPDERQVLEERSDLLWSLKKLKRYHDNKNFPHYDNFTSTSELKRILKEVKREAILDENVNQTRQYITMIWFALEKVCTEYLSIDLSGFTAYETQHMNDYQKVLVEIGERSYLNWSDGFAPELKLVYLMLTHAALFHVKKNTTNFVDFVNIIDSNKNPGEMRGPSKLFS
jgi:hypothetical protein